MFYHFILSPQFPWKHDSYYNRSGGGGDDDCYSKIKMIPGLNTSDYTALKKHYKINI